MNKIFGGRCAATVLCYFASWILCLIFCFAILQMRELFYGHYPKQPTKEEAAPLVCPGNPLRFIPRSTVRLWGERDYLIVFGMPSLDIPKRRWRRHMQRITCWRFPEVATRENNYTGAMLVLYLLARHPMHNFVLSEQVVQEAERWKDIVIHPMYEGRSSTNKFFDGKGYWGVEAEIGSSRKTFFWFQFALRQFPRVPYLAKGDDDTFLRVPQFLDDLRRLPRRRIYWGNYISKKVLNLTSRRKARVRYMLGFCFTLARDVAESFVSYKPLQHLVSTPYSKQLEPDFIAFYMNYEDLMLGWVLAHTGYSVVYVKDNNERFRVRPHSPISDSVVATHAPKFHEYHHLMARFTLSRTTSHPTLIIHQSERFYEIKSALL